MWEKEQMHVNSISSFFPQCFKKCVFHWVIKSYHLANIAESSSKITTNELCHKNTDITRRQILDSSKLKEFANFKFDENGRKLTKRVENTVGKGEIARYEQFLLFPQCFQKACFPGASKHVIVWECVKVN